MSEKKEDKELEKQDWYHGFRPRKDVSNLLREPGDWLVRATDSNQVPEIVISVLTDKRDMQNFTVRFDNGKWQLGVLKKSVKVVRFNSVVELIEHYKDTKMPGHTKLKRPVPRPTWLIKHESVAFDKTKDLLGSGNFCHVYKGIYNRTEHDRIQVAVKICHEGNASGKEFEEGRTARNQMIREAQLMSYYAHEFVIQLFGVACDHPPVLIVMEYCPGGNLESHLKKHSATIEIGERLCYALEAARGMRYLHTKNCVHRDLASRNCLISAKGLIKIADFGLSRLVAELEVPKEEGQKDDPSPQIPLRFEPDDTWLSHFTARAMITANFSLMASAYNVMLKIFNDGVKPWPDDPAKKIATNIRKGNMPDMPPKTPQEVKEMVSNIWVVDKEARPSMRKVCEAVWRALKKYKPPPENKFTLNHIPGVVRVNSNLDEDIEDHSSKAKNSTDNEPTIGSAESTGGSGGTVSRYTHPTEDENKKNNRNTGSIYKRR